MKVLIVYNKLWSCREKIFNPIKFDLKIKSIIIVSLSFCVFVFFILISSINRGYGKYDATSVVDAVKFIPDYIKSDIFIDAIGDNLELNFVYVNALNATDLFVSGEQGVLFGETLFKTFFLFLPRSVFGYKPDSMIWLYSPRVYIEKDTIVTSPVIYYAEFLWNFSIFFVFILIFFTYVMEKLFYLIFNKLAKKGLSVLVITLLVWYTINIQFVRGSGLDLLVLYVIISLPFSMFIFKFNKFLK